MDYVKEVNAFENMVTKIVKNEMKKRENYLPLLLPGEIYSVNGSFADIIINNTVDNLTDNDLDVDDYKTFAVPINPSISVVAGDHVWVLKVNFQDNDKIILCKRVIS